MYAEIYQIFQKKARVREIRKPHPAEAEWGWCAVSRCAALQFESLGWICREVPGQGDDGRHGLVHDLLHKDEQVLDIATYHASEGRVQGGTDALKHGTIDGIISNHEITDIALVHV